MPSLGLAGDLLYVMGEVALITAVLFQSLGNGRNNKTIHFLKGQSSEAHTLFDCLAEQLLSPCTCDGCGVHGPLGNCGNGIIKEQKQIRLDLKLSDDYNTQSPIGLPRSLLLFLSSPLSFSFILSFLSFLLCQKSKSERERGEERKNERQTYTHTHIHTL